VAKKNTAIAVTNARGVRTMHVGGEAIQSAMRIDDPFALALDYTRCMMAFLLFHPEPRRALMIGLGGGSLAKFFHRHFRKTFTRVVELDPQVVAAARRHFALPEDDGRFVVEVGDGVEALSPECCDVLVLDAFEDELHVPRLASREFYDGALLALPALYDPNILVFALKGSPKAVQWHSLRERAEKLERTLRLPFTRYVNRLRAMNRCTPDELLIAG
jgi:spermidine synthase